MVQTLVSGYERHKLRLNADVILRFATALEVLTGALLPPAAPFASKKPSRIEAPPVAQQTGLLRTIDTFLKGVAARPTRRA